MFFYYMVLVWLLISVCIVINVLLLSYEMFFVKGINILFCLILYGVLLLFWFDWRGNWSLESLI